MKSLAEVVVENYPRIITLEDGTQVTLRPLLKDDEAALAEYFNSLPTGDRLCIRRDVTDPQVIESWIYSLDYDNVLPLLALKDGKVVGDATLHFNTIRWTRHQGEVHLTTDPQYRVKGLGSLLIQHLMDVARQLGLEQLTAEIPPVLDKAFHFFEKLDFKSVVHLKGFAEDAEGKESDLFIMVKNLS